MSDLLDAIAEQAAEPVQALLHDDEVRQALRQALGRLSEREQTVLGLHYFEGMTLEQVADVLGISPAAAESIDLSALLSLRARLSEIGPEFAAPLMSVFAEVAYVPVDLDQLELEVFLSDLENEGVVRRSTVKRRTPAADLYSVEVGEDASRWVVEDRR